MNPKRCRSLILVLVILFLFPLGLTSAQGPVGLDFTYQGYLTGDDLPIDGTCDFQFTLWDDPAAGAQVGPLVEQLAVPVGQGRFTTRLDFGNVYDGTALWLQVAVRCGDPSYTTLSPRQALTAAPYAAATLSLRGQPLSGVSPAAGQVLEWDGANWTAATDDDTLYSAGTGLLLSGTVFYPDETYLQRRVQPCGAGYAIQQVNQDGSVVCQVVDNTTYQAGNQLTLTLTTFDVLEGAGSDLDADLLDGLQGSAYQLRVNGTCPDGSSIRVVNVDGSVVCEPDDDTNYQAGIGLFLAGTTFGITTTYRLPQGCGGGQAAEWDGTGWACATYSAFDHDHWGETWSGTGVGLTLNSSDDTGLWGSGPVYGLQGTSAATALYGEGGTYGVYATGAGTAVYADGSTSGGIYGVYATGVGTAAYAAGGLYGVYATGADTAVQADGSTSGGTYGVSATGIGTAVYASSGGTYGVYGVTSANAGTTAGIYGRASSASGYGVYGYNMIAGGTAVYGQGYSYGVRGVASGTGVFGNGPIGAWGQGSNVGVRAAGGSYGIRAFGTFRAGYFEGDIEVTGSVFKGGGGWKIDDPRDPANAYLYHSFVESPDMKNFYDGVVTLGADGTAWVELPDWFGLINQDFRYQLTPIGAAAPGLYVAQEIADNHFQIAGGPAGLKVSWLVTGIRADPWAKAYRLPVEEDKPADQRGTYLHPELYGQPPELRLGYDPLVELPVAPEVPIGGPGEQP